MNNNVIKKISVNNVEYDLEPVSVMDGAGENSIQQINALANGKNSVSLGSDVATVQNGKYVYDITFTMMNGRLEEHLITPVEPGGEIENEEPEDETMDSTTEYYLDGETLVDNITKIEMPTTGAAGNYSFSEGQNNLARGHWSHAEGFNNYAEGTYAHVEGHNTYAAGSQAHAEGLRNSAIGQASHSEGIRNVSNAKGSHTEGLYNTVNSLFAHAEGATNLIKEGSNHAHAEGWKNLVDEGSISAHVEGSLNKVLKPNAHAEGYQTIAGGQNSHSEGSLTTASGTNSHAEGGMTSATDQHSHAEGFKAQATGFAAHAEGGNTIAAGQYSHAGGYGTIASEIHQTVIGAYNKENADALFIVGNGTGDEESKRSNAFEVLKNGVKASGKKLATEEYSDRYQVVTHSITLLNSDATVYFNLINHKSSAINLPLDLFNATGNEVKILATGHVSVQGDLFPVVYCKRNGSVYWVGYRDFDGTISEYSLEDFQIQDEYF